MEKLIRLSCLFTNARSLLFSNCPDDQLYSSITPTRDASDIKALAVRDYIGYFMSTGDTTNLYHVASCSHTVAMMTSKNTMCIVIEQQHA